MPQPSAWDVDSPHVNPVQERELRRHKHGPPGLPFFRRLVSEW